MIDLYCESYGRPPREVTFDIDDTVDVVHGQQQLSLFNAHYDERCFLPIHVYDTATSRPWRCCCGPARPRRGEVRGHWRLVRRIRKHWPKTQLTIRGDSHYGRHEVMAWCEANGVDYIFGLSATTCCAVWSRPPPTMCGCAAPRRRRGARRYAETRYGAKSWKCDGAWPRASRQPARVWTSATW